MITRLRSALFMMLPLGSYATYAYTLPQQEIFVGQSIAYSGFFKPYATAISAGIRACFDQVNAHGGVHGKNLKLVSMDDQGTASQTAENIERLCKERGVRIFLGIMGTKGLGQARDRFKKKEALALFGWGYDEKLFGDIPYIIPGFPDTKAQVDALLAHTSKICGLHSVGIFHGDDAFSSKTAAYAIEKASSHHIKVRAQSAYNRLTLAIAPAAHPLLQADPQAIISVATSMPSAYLVDQFLTQGRFGTTFLSIDSGLFIASLLAQNGVQVYLASLVPPLTSTIGLIKHYLEAMHIYCPDQTPNILSCAYYCAARVLVHSLVSAADPDNLTDVYEALTGIENLDLDGLIIGYNRTTKQWWQRVWITLAQGNKS